MTGHKLTGRWEYANLPSLSYNFLKDGNGFYLFYDAKKDFTYTAKDGEVKIHFNGDFRPNTFKYIVEGDVLLIEDSFGNLVKYKKSKEMK